MRWVEADAEQLPFDDGAFDVVLSSVGVMFAPHHEQAAAELLRVCRPGGTIALANWTPEGFIGQVFATMRPYVAPPPPGASPPPLWGRESHVEAMLDGVADLSLTRRTITQAAFGQPEEFRDFFKVTYGPTIAAYHGLAGDTARTTALDGELLALADRFGAGSAPFTMPWEYLEVVARR